MKIAVGLSGGVDSAVSALLLKERGHEVVGVTMALGRADEAKTQAEAREVAARLAIPFEVADLASDWTRDVLRYVADEYRGGRTPNPCIRCNEFVKFGLLPRWAFATLGCDRFATGHYARLEPGPGGRMRLFRAADKSKDQSYFLYRVAPDVLARTLFPLGGLTKPEVREIGRRAGIAAAPGAGRAGRRGRRGRGGRLRRGRPGRQGTERQGGGRRGPPRWEEHVT